VNRLYSILSAAPRAFLVEIILAALWVDVLTLALPIFAQLIFDKVIAHNSYSTLHVVASGVLVAALFEGVLVYVFSRHIHHLSATVDESLTRPAMRKLMGLPLTYFDSRSKGEIAEHIREIQTIRDFLSVSTITAVVDLAFMFLVLLLIASYSLLLAGVVAICIPVVVFLSFLMRPIVRQRQKELNDRRSEVEALMTEGLHNISTLKAMSMEHVFALKWVTAHEKFVNASLRAKKSAAAEDVVLRVLQRLIVLAVLWVGSTQVLSNVLTFGQLLACYMLSLRVLGPSMRIYQVAMGFIRIEDAKGHLDILSSETEESPSVGRTISYKDGPISFHGVSFQYLHDQPAVLNDVWLDIKQGAFVGIVGKSGSGKSTMSKMLQRHLHPTSGYITIASTDLRELELDELRKNVVLLTHDSAIFKGTVRENVLGRNQTATDKEIWFACELALAKEFVTELPNGLDSKLDERAAQLSSGQRQRISLARAVLSKPSVLILDEATNALDAETESLVLKNIHREFKDRTFIVVTHREHLLKEADLIIRVQNGCAGYDQNLVQSTYNANRR
jgi:ATP-binding cassette, subfamily B, bacterial HlyB/CyaB